MQNSAHGQNCVNGKKTEKLKKRNISCVFVAKMWGFLCGRMFAQSLSLFVIVWLYVCVSVYMHDMDVWLQRFSLFLTISGRLADYNINSLLVYHTMWFDIFYLFLMCVLVAFIWCFHLCIKIYASLHLIPIGPLYMLLYLSNKQWTQLYSVSVRLVLLLFFLSHLACVRHLKLAFHQFWLSFYFWHIHTPNQIWFRYYYFFFLCSGWSWLTTKNMCTTDAQSATRTIFKW